VAHIDRERSRAVRVLAREHVAVAERHAGDGLRAVGVHRNARAHEDGLLLLHVERPERDDDAPTFTPKGPVEDLVDDHSWRGLDGELRVARDCGPEGSELLADHPWP